MSDLFKEIDNAIRPRVEAQAKEYLNPPGELIEGIYKMKDHFKNKVKIKYSYKVLSAFGTNWIDEIIYSHNEFQHVVTEFEIEQILKEVIRLEYGSCDFSRTIIVSQS